MSILRVDPFDCQMPFPLDERLSVPGLNDRNSIPSNATWEGMNVWVEAEKKEYKLVSKPNGTWEQVYPAATASPIPAKQVVNVGSAVPSGNVGSEGDIWVRTETAKTEIYQKTAPTVWTLKGDIPKTEVNEARLYSSADISIEWQTAMAPDKNGAATGLKYVEAFGNRAPKIQVNMETAPGVWSLNESVPVTLTKTGANISTVTIELSGINSEIIIT